MRALRQEIPGRRAEQRFLSSYQPGIFLFHGRRQARGPPQGLMKNSAPKTSRRANLALFLGVLAVMALLLGMLEAGLRFYWINREGQDAFERHWLKLQKATGVFRPQEGVINSLGFHGPEIPIHKAPHTFRVLVLGGSAVY